MRNTLYTGDNLHFLHRMDTASVDLVYLDPPFNTKRIHSAPPGSRAAGSGFRDIWTWRDVDAELLEPLVGGHPGLVACIGAIEGVHGEAMAAYTAYLAQRIAELHRVLRETGSIYLHCDPGASHCIRLVMDCVFGQGNFLNEIVWHYQTGGSGKRWFPRKHDVILLYGRSPRHVFNARAVPVPRAGKSLERARTPAGARISAGDTTKTAMDVWTDIQALNPMSRERTGYPTQKPLALLRRIIGASSNEGDVVLDPFCGCATACVAAEQLRRRWIGIDLAEDAAPLLAGRLRDCRGGDGGGGFDHVRELPERTDLALEPPTDRVRRELHGSRGGGCESCGAALGPGELEIGRIVPPGKGGSDSRSNFQLLCRDCARTREEAPMEYLRRRFGFGGGGPGPPARHAGGPTS